MTAASSFNSRFEQPPSAWSPPAGLTEHCGSPLPPDADFFVAPLPEIGQVQSAFTTLRRSAKERSWGSRLLMMLVIGGAPAMLIVYFCLRRAPEAAAPAWMVGLAFGCIIGLIVLGATGFRHRCSYVGSLGAVNYELRGRRQAAPRIYLLTFNRATELRTGQTRQYINGVYNGTNYFFRWNDETGRIFFKLNGVYRSQQGTPKRGDRYYFARAAELAWSCYLLQYADAELERHGAIQFTVSGNLQVRVGPGFLEFVRNNEPVRIERDQIKRCSLDQGQFHIAHQDARWFSSKGKFNFAYASMPNAKLFLLAVEKLVGVQIV